MDKEAADTTDSTTPMGGQDHENDAAHNNRDRLATASTFGYGVADVADNMDVGMIE